MDIGMDYPESGKFPLTSFFILDISPPINIASCLYPSPEKCYPYSYPPSSPNLAATSLSGDSDTPRIGYVLFSNFVSIFISGMKGTSAM